MKRATRLENFDNAVLSLYSKGMTVRDIQETLKDLYHVEVSPSLISAVTDAVNEKKLSSGTIEQFFMEELEFAYYLMNDVIAEGDVEEIAYFQSLQTKYAHIPQYLKPCARKKIKRKKIAPYKQA